VLTRAWSGMRRTPQNPIATKNQRRKVQEGGNKRSAQPRASKSPFIRQNAPLQLIYDCLSMLRVPSAKEVAREPAAENGIFLLFIGIVIFIKWPVLSAIVDIDACDSFDD
jgi:hypothetical protein